MALLHGKPDECPGPYRVVLKLPALPPSLCELSEIDNTVADVLAAHHPFIEDLADLVARALLQVHGESEPIEEGLVYALATQIPTSLAVAILERGSLQAAIADRLFWLGAEGRSQLSCPE